MDRSFFSNITIRRASPQDAEAIVSIRREAWLSIYPNPSLGITQTDLYRHLDGETGELKHLTLLHWQRQIGKEDGKHSITYVAQHDGAVIGFVAPRFIREQRRIATLYVTTSARCHGVGTKLLKRAIEWFGRDQDIYLQVVAYNEVAISFYKRFGFELTTGKPFIDPVVQQQSELQLPEVEMVLKAISIV
jgi:GNAT superfamily N-acetyltransferase